MFVTYAYKCSIFVYYLFYFILFYTRRWHLTIWISNVSTFFFYRTWQTRARTLIQSYIESCGLKREIYRQMFGMRTRRNKLFRLCIPLPSFSATVTSLLVCLHTWNQHVNFACYNSFLFFFEKFTFTSVAVVSVIVVVVVLVLVFVALLIFLLSTLSPPLSVQHGIQSTFRSVLFSSVQFNAHTSITHTHIYIYNMRES